MTEKKITRDISKEQFMAYEGVRESGATNMFEVNMVIKLAFEVYGVALKREDVMEIMARYCALHDKFISGENYITKKMKGEN